MAGRPKQRAVAAELEKRAREDEGTTLDYVCDWIASGKTQLSLLREISAATGLDIQHATLARYLKDNYGDEATARLDIARRTGSHAMVEDAVEIIEQADTSSRENLQHAKMKADIRTWIAGKANRDVYGDSKGATINVSIAGLHLGALRQATVTATIVQPDEPAQLVSGEENE